MGDATAVPIAPEGYTFRYSKKMLRRIELDPGLPAKSSTNPVWQQPPHKLANIRSMELPQTADVVLIGSGITACAIARHILHSSPSLARKPRVAIVEARTLCSGASGRNGGHVRDSPFMYFRSLRESYGLETAKKMLTFRSRCMEDIIRVVKEEGILEVAEFRAVEAVDLILEQERWDDVLASLEEYCRNISPDEGPHPKVYDSHEAREAFNVPKAVGALTSSAFSHSTYRLVTTLFERMLGMFPMQLSIDTSTPVHQIRTENASTFPFAVLTPRGSIRARHVVHCTNSHAAHLLPGLLGKIFPTRDQLVEQVYPAVPPGENAVDRSWIFYWNKGLEYMIRRAADASREPAYLLGGGLSHATDDGLGEIGQPDDSEEAITVSAYMYGLLPNIFHGPRNTNVKSSWTGILGWSADLLPWVGPIPPSISGRYASPAMEHEASQNRAESWEATPGREWISAGYSGEGMTLAWRCGKAIASMILGTDVEVEVPNWLPEQYIITEKRVREADVRKLKELY